MKKVFALMSIVAMFSMVACGPAKNNEEAEKQRIEDSIRVADSNAAVQAAMEAEMNAAAQAADTTAGDSAAAPADGTHEGH